MARFVADALQVVTGIPQPATMLACNLAGAHHMPVALQWLRSKAGLNGHAPALSRLIAVGGTVAGKVNGAQRARSGGGSELAKSERRVTAAQKKVVRLERELASERRRLDESEQRIARLQSEVTTQSCAASEAEVALGELRHRLAQTESALAQRRHESEQTAGELVTAGEDLRRLDALHAQADKVSAGLREHVVLLLADVKQRQAAIEALQQAHRAELANRDTALDAVASQVKTVLAALDTSRHALAARLEAQMLETAQVMRKAEEQAVEANLAVARLLDEHGRHFLWSRTRLRRRLQLVKRSGLFDAAWYLGHYSDVTKSGMDPLRHYVECGAREGRAPNAALAHANGRAKER